MGSPPTPNGFQGVEFNLPECRLGARGTADVGTHALLPRRINMRRALGFLEPSPAAGGRVRWPLVDSFGRPLALLERHADRWETTDPDAWSTMRSSRPTRSSPSTRSIAARCRPERRSCRSSCAPSFPATRCPPPTSRAPPSAAKSTSTTPDAAWRRPRRRRPRRWATRTSTRTRSSSTAKTGSRAATPPTTSSTSTRTPVTSRSTRPASAASCAGS